MAATIDLAHFVAAQAPVWPQVQAELRAGRKTSHWMWFIFPQHAALGQSQMARRFGLASLAEAQAYAATPCWPRGCCTPQPWCWPCLGAVRMTSSARRTI